MLNAYLRGWKGGSVRRLRHKEPQHTLKTSGTTDSSEVQTRNELRQHILLSMEWVSYRGYDTADDILGLYLINKQSYRVIFVLELSKISTLKR